MESFASLAPTTAEWHTPHVMQRLYELTSGDHQLGTLQFTKMLGSLAEGRTADGAWTFKRGGFLRPFVTIREIGADKDLGVLHTRWGGDGDLTLTNGFHAEWMHTNFWRTRWSFQHKGGREIVHFTPHHKLLKAGATVEIPQPVSKDVPLPMLTLLGWYLMVLMSQDAAAAAAAAG